MDDRTEFRDQGGLFQEQSQDTVAGGVHGVHRLRQMTPFATSGNTEGNLCLCREGIVVGFCIYSQIGTFQFVGNLLLGMRVQKWERMDTIESESGRNISQGNLEGHQQRLPNNGGDCTDVSIVRPYISFMVSREGEFWLVHDMVLYPLQDNMELVRGQHSGGDGLCADGRKIVIQDGDCTLVLMNSVLEGSQFDLGRGQKVLPNGLPLQLSQGVENTVHPNSHGDSVLVQLVEETPVLTQLGFGQVHHPIQFGQVPMNLILVLPQSVDVLFQHL